jgi:Zn-dependent protease with chaperone function
LVAVPPVAEPSRDRFEAVAASAELRAYALGVAAAVVAGILVAVLTSWWLGVVVLLVVGLAWVLWVRSLLGSAVGSAVAGLGAVQVGSEEAPSLCNAIEGVSVLAGVKPPELHLLRTDSANAMCAAGAGESAVVVTSGLLEGLHPTELEVVAAELLCRIRDGSARVGTLAAVLPGWLGGMCGVGQGALAALLGDQRALRADLDALSITRYPPALISVLARMEAAGSTVAGADPASTQLWLAPAIEVADGVDPALVATVNQPLAHRIAVLREL